MILKIEKQQDYHCLHLRPDMAEMIDIPGQNFFIFTLISIQPTQRNIA